MHRLVVAFSAATLLVLIISPSLVAGVNEDSNCPQICPPGGDPVCGSDDIIYPSDCEMRKKTCNKGVRVSQLSEYLCQRSQGSNCTHQCNEDSDPVCGTDGKTYLNKCFMKMETCKTGAILSHLGPCSNITAHSENCPASCSVAPNDGPICGSDGNVYPNTCIMKMRTCRQGVVSMEKSNCKTCKEACWRVTKPVCGSDGVIYPNSCKMRSQNCGKNIIEIPMRYCMSVTQNFSQIIPSL
ncbi:four-domain proteases inhibitor-like [Neocloeon triangulifer]|uniref:four-domain proteases inhibitor-like n=1 Tax=Neocloeon triangulifer TaxID=2078957 RepID=UPI00286ECFAE|nr:four-domain proteases inhibitor-like [Neocloeon triangulifer]